MLTHFIGILCLAIFSGADVPSRLLAISQVKGIIHDLQHDLVKFKENEQAELSKLLMANETTVKNEPACLEMSQAHNETIKMLFMMVEGERNELEMSETSLEDMNLKELSELWGALAPGGKSRVRLEKEIDNYRKTAKTRITEAEASCKTSSKPDKSPS